MACEGLTGLPKVWCQFCEALRNMWEPGTAEEQRVFMQYRTGQRDVQAGEDEANFLEAVLKPRLEAINAPQEVIDTITQAGEMGFPNNVMFGSLAYFSYIQATFRGWLGVAALPVQYQMMGELGVARPDPTTAWAMFWRGLGETQRNNLLNDLGWTQDLIDRFGDVTRPRLSPAELFRHMHLTGGGAAAVYNELGRRGFTAEDAGAMSDLSKLIPGPGDLIRMAVREAWRDDVAAKWGYDADFPAEFAEWMRKQGDTEGWARKYWRAHWELPGLTTVLDILYRVPEFDIDDLDTYLRISDIPAAWRDYIKRTAYRPLTRVDVRRMYGMGVLSRDEVKRNYLDLGYNDTNAERMTNFTVRYETDDDREATKADILSFLNVGAITSDEATTWLMSIGYPDDLASYLVARELMKAAQKQVDRQVKLVQDLYIHQEITVTEASAKLGAIGVPAGEINQLLDEWQIDREAKIERPSRATLDKLLLQDVISEQDYAQGLDALGYQDKYVNWYLSSILQQKTADASKEEERARKEQNDIRTRKIKSDYQVTKAQLDVDIAEVQTAISDTQLALRERQVRYQEELRVAHGALTTAELREVAGRDIANLEAQIKDQEGAIAFLREQIDVLETGVADLQLKGVPQPRPLTAGEAAVATREREVEIENLKAEIEAVQTEIAGIKLAASPEVATIEPGVAEAAILERQLTIETLQDSMASLEVEIAEIRLERTITVADLTTEEVERQTREIRVAIELAQDDIAKAQTSIAGLRSQIHQRRVQLDVDLRIVEQVRSVEEIEVRWETDLLAMTSRLTELRGNLSELREQKAQLAVEYRVGLAEE